MWEEQLIAKTDAKKVVENLSLLHVSCYQILSYLPGGVQFILSVFSD